MMKSRIGVLIALLMMTGCGNNVHQKEQETNIQQTKFAVQKTEEEWKAELPRQQYYVMREKETEPRYSSSLIKVTDEGVMTCAACGNPLFDNARKYTTTSAWPSFDRPIAGAVVYAKDYKLGYLRTEVLCARCGGHLGHVFNDGPRETTGKRYCINGASLAFVAEETTQENKDK